jgi:small-conductance mechanosensitive channel
MFVTLSTFADGQMTIPFGIQVSEKMLDMLGKIALSVATMALALVIGLYLRRQLTRRLAKTILDNWIIQTLGALAFFLPLILGGIVALAIWNNLPTIIDSLNDKAHINLYQIALQLIETLILIALGIGVARTLRKQIVNGLKRGLGETRFDINTRTLFGRIVHILVLTIAGFWMLSIWNIALGIPLAAVSVVTLAITVSLQDILKDFVAGFYLLITRPFYIGDQISVVLAAITYVGKVQNIELRATRLRLITGEEASIPNSSLFLNPVVNLSYFSERRATIEIKLPQTNFSQQETAHRILQELKETEIIAKPEPVVLFQGFTEEKALLFVRFWIANSHSDDISEVMYTLHALLPDADLAIREPAANTV